MMEVNLEFRKTNHEENLYLDTVNHLPTIQPLILNSLQRIRSLNYNTPRKIY